MENNHTKKRVLLWYWGRKGGAARQTLEEVKAFAARNDVEVYVSLCKENELFDEILSYAKDSYNVSIFPNKIKLIVNTLLLPRYKREFKRFLKQSEIDIVYCIMGHATTTYIAPVIKELGITYYFTIHDAINHPGEERYNYEQYIRKNYEQATCLIVHSQHVKEMLIATYGLSKDRIIYVPLGTYHYNSKSGVRSLNTDKPIQLIFFGRIVKYKGLELALQAQKELIKQGYNTVLNIYGLGNLEPYTALLQNTPAVFVNNRWISDEEIEPIFNAMDIVVLPYIEASQSGVLPLAADMGLPVVATPVGGLIEQIAQYKCGVLCKDITSLSIATSIERLILSPEYYRSISLKAIASAKQFSWGNIVEAILYAK